MGRSAKRGGFLRKAARARPTFVRRNLMRILPLSYALACLVAIALAPATAAAAPDPAWSPTVRGLRGRLIATASEDARHRPQLRLELELENVSDRAAPIALAWSDLEDMLALAVVDDHGAAIEQSHPGGNRISGPPFVLLLPVASALRVTISPAAYEYLPGGRTSLRPLTFQAWDVPSPRAPRSLRATFHPSPAAPADPARWSGVLALPAVALP
jgi:hypothetical protein